MRTKRSEFEFTLDPKFIAQEPLQSRDESKLMVIHRETGLIEHKVFTDIKDYFHEEDVMIFNNTRVFPARLVGKKEKTGARIEVFLLRELNKKAKLWDVLVDPARKIRVGNKLYFSDKDDEDILVAEVVDNTTSRGRTIRFFYDEDQYKFEEILDRIGKMPIPKYINRDANEFDRERYQTLYASEAGAVAAPTAGLHFSKRLMKQFEINGVDFAEVTLHVGLGTFRGIEVEDLSKHKMDAEYFRIEQDAVDTVVKGQKNNRKICSVGTTSMRAIESAVSATGHLKTAEGWTHKFIYPPHEFSIANAMVTNFHLPKSSLMIMVCAFAGTELLKEAYEMAKKEDYRFYSYGDAMLII